MSLMKIEANEHLSNTGTSLRGCVTTTYATLVKAFGEPAFLGESGDGKTTAEWSLEVTDADGDTHVAYIYDWKQYEDGTPYGLYEWHIGGKDPIVVDAIQDAVNAVS
jgi:hypothetical protein